MQESIGYMYYTRQLQVGAIFHSAEEAINNEINDSRGNFQKLDSLLTTPPILLDSLFRSSGLGREDFLKQAAGAAKITAKREKVLIVILGLYEACQADIHSFKEVPIDLANVTIPPSIKLIFKEDLDLLTTTVAEGREEGTGALLQLVQGDTPLMRYRRDLAHRFELQDALDGGQIGYIPTQIPKVNLKFWYERTERIPKLAFQVNTFSEEALKRQ